MGNDAKRGGTGSGQRIGTGKNPEGAKRENETEANDRVVAGLRTRGLAEWRATIRNGGEKSGERGKKTVEDRKGRRKTADRKARLGRGKREDDRRATKSRTWGR